MFQPGSKKSACFLWGGWRGACFHPLPAGALCTSLPAALQAQWRASPNALVHNRTGSIIPLQPVFRMPGLIGRRWDLHPQLEFYCSSQLTPRCYSPLATHVPLAQSGAVSSPGTLGAPLHPVPSLQQGKFTVIAAADLPLLHAVCSLMGFILRMSGWSCCWKPLCQQRWGCQGQPQPGAWLWQWDGEEWPELALPV